jgi:hypothetical protein
MSQAEETTKSRYYEKKEIVFVVATEVALRTAVGEETTKSRHYEKILMVFVVATLSRSSLCEGEETTCNAERCRSRYYGRKTFFVVAISIALRSAMGKKRRNATRSTGLPNP